MQQSEAQLKRKLRQLKKLEIKIRFGKQPASQDRRLIWDTFFSTRAENDEMVKYPLHQLRRMDRESLKAVFEAYFYAVYFQSYKEKGLRPEDVYDPQLLSLLDLKPDTGIEGIKRKFRELAKRYHPDHGGDSESFIELVDTYEKLTSI